jgi:hypothetical protein
VADLGPSALKTEAAVRYHDFSLVRIPQGLDVSVTVIVKAAPEFLFHRAA